MPAMTPADRVGQLGAHLRLVAGVADGLAAGRLPALVESMRTSTNRSPMVAMTACAVSQAVVTAPTTAMRPFQSRVCPPSVPTSRYQRPS